jgi:hypothetical protein
LEALSDALTGEDVGHATVEVEALTSAHPPLDDDQWVMPVEAICGAPVELWVKIRRPDTGFGGQPEDPAGRAGWGSCATRARRRRAGEAGVAEPRAARQATGIPGSVLASNSWFAGILVA